MAWPAGHILVLAVTTGSYTKIQKYKNTKSGVGEDGC